MESIERNIIVKCTTVRNLMTKYTIHTKNNIGHCHSDFFESALTIGSRQLDILHIIIRNNINTVSGISKELDLSASGLSLTISKMVKQNLLVKLYDETNDARNVIIKPTDEAMVLYNLLMSTSRKYIIDFYDTQTDSEKELYLNSIISFTNAFKSFGVNGITSEMDFNYIVDLILDGMFVLKKYFEQFFRDAENEYSDRVTFTRKETEILILIRNEGINTPSELANLTMTKESTISLQLKSLVKNNFLVKEKSKEDSRKTFFILTELGAQTLQKDIDIIEQIFFTLINTFTDEEKENILNGLSNLEVLFNLLLARN